MEIITLFGEGFSTKTYELTLKHPTPRTDEWACVGEDPELFHPEDLTQLAEAQQVCTDCPMRQTCLELGTARREWGVWGGVLLESGKPRHRAQNSRTKALQAKPGGDRTGQPRRLR